MSSFTIWHQTITEQILPCNCFFKNKTYNERRNLLKPVFRTFTEVGASYPGRVITAPRFAMIAKDKKVVIPKGSLLIHLVSEDKVQVYRTSDGMIVTMERPIGHPEAEEVTDKEIITAMNAYKSLPELMLEKGLRLDNYSHISPFNVIRCPICGGTDFTCQDHGTVYCYCGAFFQLRSTGGDPGFVVDCFPGSYIGDPVKYILPSAYQKLYYYMVFKEECIFSGEEAAEFTDDTNDTIRAGVDKRDIFEVYSWKLAGVVPSSLSDLASDVGDDGSFKIEGESMKWPKTAIFPTLSSTPYSHEVIQRALWELESNQSSPQLIKEMRDLAALPKMRPFVTSTSRPNVKGLNAGEKYLLHHWGVIKKGMGEPFAAIPVWYKVRLDIEKNYINGFIVIDKNICPQCGKAISIQDWNELGNVKLPESYWHETENKHGGCLSTIRKIGWVIDQPMPEKQ